MNLKLLLALQDTANNMKQTAILMLDTKDYEHIKHAKELYGASEMVEQWIKELGEV